MICTLSLYPRGRSCRSQNSYISLGRPVSVDFPTGLLLIDGPAAVGAKRVGKAIDLNLCQPVRDRALDNDRHALQRLFVGNSRRLGELVDQLLFFGFGRGLLARCH